MITSYRRRRGEAKADHSRNGLAPGLRSSSRKRPCFDPATDDLLRLADDLAHDLGGRPDIVHERAGLASIEAAIFHVTFEPGKRRDCRVTDHFDRMPANADPANDRTFSGTLSGRGATGVLPLSNRTVAQHPVRSIGPADIE